jgi:hypothetical protein
MTWRSAVGGLFIAFVEIQGQPEASKMIPETGVAESDAKSR